MNSKGSGDADSAPDQTGDVITQVQNHLRDISDFVAKGVEHLQVAELHLLALESKPNDSEALAALYRVFRSIKRTAAVLRLGKIEDYAAEFLELTKRAVEAEIEMDGGHIDRCFDAVDILKRHLQYVRETAASGSPLIGPRTLAKLRAPVESMGPLGRVTLDEIDQRKLIGMRLGDILVSEGIASRAEIEATRREQETGHTGMRIGDVLFEQVKVPRYQLERAEQTQKEDPDSGRMGEILVAMGAVAPSDVDQALEKQQHATTPKIGEMLVRSGRVSAKTIAHTVRKQGFIRDTLRYGLASMAARFAPFAPQIASGVDARGRLTGELAPYRNFVDRVSAYLGAADIRLLALESDPHDGEALRELHRVFHGITRMADFLKLKDIHAFSRATDLLINKANQRDIELVGPVLDVALDAVAVLERHVDYVDEAVESGEPMKREKDLPAYIACVRATADGDRQGMTTVSLAPAASGKHLGEILVESGAVSTRDLYLTLEEQSREPEPLRLGDILIEEAKASPDQIQEAVTAQREDPSQGKIGDILVSWGILERTDIDAALERQLHPPRPRLGTLLVRSGRVSARKVAQALRSQRVGMAAPTAAALMATTIMIPHAQAHADTAVAGGSVVVSLSGDAQDTDGDGLPDAAEETLGTDASSADTDQDLIDDAWEIHSGLSPTDASDAEGDLDQDRVTNLEEYELGTSPLERDSDADGFWDGIELDRGTDPAKSDSQPYSGVYADVDRDGKTDVIDLQHVINAALGLATPVPANVNQVGGVNALDIQAAINAVLGK